MKKLILFLLLFSFSIESQEITVIELFKDEDLEKFQEENTQYKQEQETNKSEQIKQNIKSLLPPCESNKTKKACYGKKNIPRERFYSEYGEYRGEFKKGLRHGLGVFDYCVGDICFTYVGEWKKDKRTGDGVLTYPDDSRSYYKGEFKNGFFHGYGIWETYNKETGQLNGRYEGNFKKSEYWGDGILTYGNRWETLPKKYQNQSWTYIMDGITYSGKFKWGLKHGKGTVIRSDGTGYIGNFKKGNLTKKISELNNIEIPQNQKIVAEIDRKYQEQIKEKKIADEKRKVEQQKILEEKAKEEEKNIAEQKIILEEENLLKFSKIIIEKFNLNERAETLFENIEFVEISNDLVKDYYINYFINEKFTKQIKSQNDELIDSFSKNHIFFYSTKKALNRRMVESRNFHSSSFLVGVQTIENPDYAKLLIEIDVHSRKVDRAYYALENAKDRKQKYEEEQSGKSCGKDAWANVLCGVIEGMTANDMVEGPQKEYDRLQNELEAMNNRLSSMPLTIDKEIFEKYQYNTSNVKSAKNSEIILHHVNLITKKIQSVKIQHEEINNFTMAYNLHSEDKNLDSIIAKYESENDVTNWERSNLEIPFNELIQNININQIITSNYNSSNQITSDIVEVIPKQNEIESVSQSSEVVKTEYDNRFTSVVIVKNPSDGSFGTGFYITPNLIITNYHVIEGSPNPGIQLFQQGYDVMGRVIATDLRLDLALIEIAYKGTPLEIASDLSLKMGEEVDAIGHPFGNYFTLTRGIISAVRESESTFMVGGKPVIYIQTDTAVNSGNSGGPLFLNNVVVGVNTQVIRKDLAEGLNFAVHFKELNEFIKLNKK